MKRYLPLIALLITGCTSDIPSPVETAQDQKYCSSIARPLSDGYTNCMVSRDQMRIQATQERKARSLALMNVGTGVLAAQPAYQPVRQTTCRQQGVYVNCTSY